MSPHMPIFFADILSAGADNNNSKMVCALTAYITLHFSGTVDGNMQGIGTCSL